MLDSLDRYSPGRKSNGMLEKLHGRIMKRERDCSMDVYKYIIYKIKLLRKDLDTERSYVAVFRSNMIQLLITMILLLMNLMRDIMVYRQRINKGQYENKMLMDLITLRIFYSKCSNGAQ